MRRRDEHQHRRPRLAHQQLTNDEQQTRELRRRHRCFSVLRDAFSERTEYVRQWRRIAPSGETNFHRKDEP
eukprot:SAG31_NODE_2884_length_4954_cov_2.669619_8_plen_71_part_00